MTSIKQDNFSGGEIAPAIQANSRLAKRQTGLGLCRNAIIDRHGTIQNRAGFEYITEAASSSYGFTNLIPFVINSETAYQLEISNGTVRVYQGTTLKDTIANTPWAGSTAIDIQWQQSGNIMTIVGKDYAPYEIERVSDTNWTCTAKSMTPTIRPPTLMAASSITAGSNDYFYGVTAVDANGNESYVGSDSTVVSGGAGPLGDAYTTYDFTFFASGHAFQVDDRVYVDSGTIIPQINGHTFTVTAIDTNDFTVGGVDLGSLQPDNNKVIYLGGISQTNPCSVSTVGPHGLSTGNQVYISGSGMVELNDRLFTITVTGSDSLTLDGEDATAHTAGSAGYMNVNDGALRLYKQGLSVTNAAVPTDADPHTITWNGAGSVGVVSYNVYKKDSSGTWGLIGVTTEETFNDTGIAPDTSIRPPSDSLDFFNDTDWPACVGAYQQRLCVGNTTDNVELFKASRVGDTKDFTLRVPVQDDDPVEASLVGSQVNEIRHIIDVGGLVLLTEGGEWIAQGDANGTLTPASPGLKQGSYRGCSKTRPVVVGTKALFVENDGKTIRDLGYEFQSDTYVGNDLTTFASHLFEYNRVIVDWAYQSSPNSTVWIIVDDANWQSNRSTSTSKTKNMLIGLTYIPEQEVWAFHRHDSNGGEFESICATPGDDGTDVTVVVKRTVNGATKRYIERLNNRVITDHTSDAIFLDAYLTYDGRNVGATTMTLTAITDYSADTSITLNSSVGYFVSGDVDNQIILRSKTYAFDEDTGSIQETVERVVATIRSYTSATEVVVTCSESVPSSLQATATTDWGKAVDTISGLGHLEGESVYAVIDGTDSGPYTVASGSISLSNGLFGEVIHVGLRYFSDVETLPIDTPNAQDALTDKQIVINKVTIEVNDSRGFKVGPDYSSLQEILQGTTTGTDGKQSLTINCTWAKNGKVFIRQDKPLAMHITGITLDGQLEGGLN